MLKFTDDNVEHQKVCLSKFALLHPFIPPRTSVGPTRPRKPAGRNESMCLLCRRFPPFFTLLDPKLNISNVCGATGAEPPVEEGERETQVWAQAQEAGGERGRVPPPEWKTGSTNNLLKLFTSWFR